LGGLYLARCIIFNLKLEEDSSYNSVYKGKTYYFHTKEEKEEFDRNPQKYASK